MGLMLESASNRLTEAGMAHDNAPDKKPALRLRAIEEAGALRIPFTTGIDALLEIRRVQQRFGHIQEVIIQNFRAKPDIPMRNHPEPSLVDHAKTIAVARLLMRDMNIQAPPNLSDEQYPFLLKAGINDWGGISPLTRDFINPEKPWPHIDELAERTGLKRCSIRFSPPWRASYLGLYRAMNSVSRMDSRSLEQPGPNLKRSFLLPIAFEGNAWVT
jgi:7,8-didemethyl-8-hydroxy-5-deazariboflavin synthase CofG subunit